MVYIKRPHYENHSGLLTTIQRRNIQINKITQNTLLQGENDFAVWIIKEMKINCQINVQDN